MTTCDLVRRSGVALALGLWLLVLCPPDIALAETFRTTDGETFDGEVLAATVNTVTVRVDSGYAIIPRADISSVSVAVDGDAPVEGVFEDWVDGMCAVRVGDRLIGVKDGIVMFDTSAEQNAAATPALQPSAPPRQTTTSAPEPEIAPERNLAPSPPSTTDTGTGNLPPTTNLPM